MEDDDAMMSHEETEAKMTAEEIKMLKDENIKLRADLEECTSIVFARVSKQDQASDASIRDDYIGICTAIEAQIKKVVANSSKDEFKTKYWENLRRLEEGRSLAKYLNRSVGLDPHELGNFDTCDYFILNLIMGHWLNKTIFERQYPVGITKQQGQVIDEIETGMQSPALSKGNLTAMETISILTIS